MRKDAIDLFNNCLRICSDVRTFEHYFYLFKNYKTKFLEKYASFPDKIKVCIVNFGCNYYDVKTGKFFPNALKRDLKFINKKLGMELNVDRLYTIVSKE